MCRSKRVGWLLPVLAAVTVFQACAVPEKWMADTGSSGKKEIAREEYLNVNALSSREEEGPGGRYTVYTLTRGTFVEEILSQKLGREFINTTVVSLDLGEQAYKLESYSVNYFDHVNAGDVIATFRASEDEIATTEAQQKLQRLQEQYQRAVLEREDEVREQEKERKELLLEVEKQGLTEECYEIKAFDMRVGQSELTWEYERQKKEQEVEDAKKELDKLVGNGGIYQLTAPVEGYVVFSSRWMEGSTFTGSSPFCEILNGKDYYLRVERQGERFCYGMDLSVDTLFGEKTGRVVSAGSIALYGNLNTGDAIIRLDMDDTELLDSGDKSNTLQGSLGTVSDVLLVPKQAVSEENKEYFVTVLKEDGSLLKTKFIPGGSNDEYYWVMNGLKEGMQIIYK